ncbi:MAG TPA: hypothetical protein VHR66_10170 [Gemmataceae bacterium]|jgi:hypothetical protein|nr:hypothetical protein [Gemmataceae bacterium]
MSTLTQSPAQVVQRLLPALTKEELRKDLEAFLANVKELEQARAKQARLTGVTVEMNNISENICKLSRRILFRIWPADDGFELAGAVIDLFREAADLIPHRTEEYPLLGDFAENIRLRADDLQPLVVVGAT